MMDILLSLPIVSFFLSSSSTSLSTSLNLLFFYLTWSTLVLSQGPLKIQLLGTLALRLGVFLLPSLLFLAFDTLLPSLAVSLKHGKSPHKALPPRNPRLLARTLALALLNILLETALEAGATWGLTSLLGHPPFKTTTTLPLPLTVIKQLAWLYLAREAFTYTINRVLLHDTHRPQLRFLSRFFRSTALSTTKARAQNTTSYLARLHATSAAHTRRAPPYALLRAAEHPIPFLLQRFVPLFAPAALAVRPHLLVYLLFAALVTFEETLAMSGYNVVPGFLMGGIARRTAVHYEQGSGDGGNYSASGVLDWVGGTGMGGKPWEGEGERGEIGSGERAGRGVVAAIGDGVEGLRGVRRRGKRGSGSD